MALILASSATTAAGGDIAPPSNLDATVFCSVWPNGRDALLSSWNDDGGDGRDQNWAIRI